MSGEKVYKRTTAAFTVHLLPALIYSFMNLEQVYHIYRYSEIVEKYPSQVYKFNLGSTDGLLLSLPPPLLAIFHLWVIAPVGETGKKYGTVLYILVFAIALCHLCLTMERLEYGGLAFLGTALVYYLTLAGLLVSRDRGRSRGSLLPYKVVSKLD